ncbi:hypothetical protein BD309DRAFT_732548 [Dichomitus squalens]|uniref:Uncharacterized protein n=1 Tax=Dichomitus squalens TaxID=114155 RepID=A0A4Q9NU61_9APHY|nr:hypothetical protein BD309DRAFT_732548 [Dichomitus squalens]TBU61445.1 hypothetical protein BD310DRAFT_195543 [Dichomitus squalens]
MRRGTEAGRGPTVPRQRHIECTVGRAVPSGGSCTRRRARVPEIRGAKPISEAIIHRRHEAASSSADADHPARDDRRTEAEQTAAGAPVQGCELEPAGLVLEHCRQVARREVGMREEPRRARAGCSAPRKRRRCGVHHRRTWFGFSNHPPLPPPSVKLSSK